MKTKLTDEAKKSTSLCFDEQVIAVEYGFSSAASESYTAKSHKILIEIHFVHPVRKERVDLCVVKSVLILCQPAEVVEAVIRREVKEFLQLFPSAEQKFDLYISQPNLEIA